MPTRAGRTPNPVRLCNGAVKFGRLLRDRHRARVRSGGDRALRTERARRATGAGAFSAAVDRQKDQTYVLYRLDQTQLAARALSAGGRPEGRRARGGARPSGLAVADKPDSQDLCFVPRGDYRAFLRRGRPVRSCRARSWTRTGACSAGTTAPPASPSGSAEDCRPWGSPATSRARRRRLRPGRGAPREPARSMRDVARRGRELDRDRGTGRREGPSASRRASATRPRLGPHPRRPGRGRIAVHFDEPAFAPAPGQALVAYVGEAVLCGGRIHASP